MKKKTYKWILGLFLVFFYTVLIVFCTFNTTKNLSRLKESYRREYNFLVTNITKDLLVMENREYQVSKAIEVCFYEYKKQCEEQNVYLQIYKGNECLYSNFEKEQIINVDENMIKTSITSLNKRKYMTVSGCLPERYNAYTLVYYTDVTDIINEWTKNNIYLFMATILFSSVLSICLVILLEYLFKPLEEISVVSTKIANGDYQKKLDIKGEGEIGEVVRNFNTMSDQIEKQVQKLQANAEEKQSLIDNLAHELRTPLTAIYGYAEYIQKTKLDEKDKYDSTQFILRESRRLKNISEILLELTALREETLLEMRQVDIEQLFKRLHQIENVKLKEKEIQFTYSSSLKVIYGNEDLLESMLINLVDNAIRACERADSRIILNAYEEGEYKIIEVIDNGKGMTKEQTSHITEPFYRVDKARSRKKGGNGLGLALCEEIAKKHDAKLIFKSEMNQGTTIKIVFNQNNICLK